MACCAKKGTEIGSKSGKVEDRKFVPNYSERALSEKFYSKYERIDSCMTISDEIAAQITAHQKYDRKEHYLAPVCENQVYGWYEHLADRYTYNKDDIGITSHPRKVDAQISNMVKIAVGIKRLGMKS